MAAPGTMTPASERKLRAAKARLDKARANVDKEWDAFKVVVQEEHAHPEGPSLEQIGAVVELTKGRVYQLVTGKRSIPKKPDAPKARRGRKAAPAKKARKRPVKTTR